MDSRVDHGTQSPPRCEGNSHRPRHRAGGRTRRHSPSYSETDRPRSLQQHLVRRAGRLATTQIAIGPGLCQAVPDRYSRNDRFSLSVATLRGHLKMPAAEPWVNFCRPTYLKGCGLSLFASAVPRRDRHRGDQRRQQRDTRVYHAGTDNNAHNTPSTRIYVRVSILLPDPDIRFFPPCGIPSKWTEEPRDNGQSPGSAVHNRGQFSGVVHGYGCGGATSLAPISSRG